MDENIDLSHAETWHTSGSLLDHTKTYDFTHHLDLGWQMKIYVTEFKRILGTFTRYEYRVRIVNLKDINNKKAETFAPN